VSSTPRSLPRRSSILCRSCFTQTILWPLVEVDHGCATDTG
jgi:hypothetical protein